MKMLVLPSFLFGLIFGRMEKCLLGEAKKPYRVSDNGRSIRVELEGRKNECSIFLFASIA